MPRRCWVLIGVIASVTGCMEASHRYVGDVAETNALVALTLSDLDDPLDHVSERVVTFAIIEPGSELGIPLIIARESDAEFQGEASGYALWATVNEDVAHGTLRSPDGREWKWHAGSVRDPRGLYLHADGCTFAIVDRRDRVATGHCEGEEAPTTGSRVGSVLDLSSRGFAPVRSQQSGSLH